MIPSDWQLTHPIDTVIFDCDGTLSRIEGIDELATTPTIIHTVQELTQQAMNATGMNPEIYRQRLELVKPTHKQIIQLGSNYIRHATPFSREVIQILRSLNKSVYIVSAGIAEAVTIFAQWLGVNEEHVYAVKLSFNEQGQYLDFDHQSPLVYRDGKKVIVNEFCKQNKRVGFVGDGLNDLVVRGLVTRFIGYGGAYYRSHIAAQCDFYVKTDSFAPLLPLLLTQEEYTTLNQSYKNLYHSGLESVDK